MHAAVQPPCGRIGRIRPAHRLRIIGIDQQHFACPDAGEMHLVGVDQKAAAVRIDSDQKMVGHGLMHPEPRRPAELAGEIDAFSVERTADGCWGRQVEEQGPRRHPPARNAGKRGKRLSARNRGNEICSGVAARRNGDPRCQDACRPPPRQRESPDARLRFSRPSMAPRSDPRRARAGCGTAMAN